MQGYDTDNTDDIEPQPPDYAPQSPDYYPFDTIILPTEDQLQNIRHRVKAGEMGENDTVAVFYEQYGQLTAQVVRVWREDEVLKASIKFYTGVMCDCEARMLVRVKEEAL